MIRFTAHTENTDPALQNIWSEVKRHLHYFCPKYDDRETTKQELRNTIIQSMGDGIVSYGFVLDNRNSYGSIHMICHNYSGEFKLVRISVSAGKWVAQEDVKWNDLKEVLDHITHNWL